MITVEHLCKRYGDFTAVKDLSFAIDEGHVYGFLGPNGAGKSTTMNIMTGCLSATSGSVKIDGFDIFENPKEAKKRIGYLPEQPPLYMNETPEEYLRFVGEAKGLKGAELSAQIEEVLKKTKTWELRHRRISALSKGYKQRVGIAQALLGSPKVIILDEPTVGLDPIQIIEIRELIRELGQQHTVILSSHILSEVQTLCEKILIIAKGELIAFDAPENLEARLLAPSEIRFTAEASAQEAEQLLASLAHVTEHSLAEKETGLVTGSLKTDCENIYEMSRALFFAFAQKGLPLLEVTLNKANLEDIFIQLTEGAEEAQPEENPQPESPAAETEPETTEREAREEEA